ncbi:histone-lysine N-methyltransferase ASHH1 [Ricinus communis]|uniref:Set domain protein, putative n=1 Tax=Ricinus communis TaxID=3988 RepID=B9SRQ0_RICCO|nr:histone-lysine N-methyltransferase ASHH1 [Ricinus communis]XP_015580549.1 histone-lysine N-methyltransferase ASHH1 [Ricinus communis]XP_015580550.1 histone-lysine N-methyltransferase ASHH1 [Ricinus communis]XP_015580551.1 histone-lysine N-methyltransferase ASHH1 [Ricinus communis]EEF33708.1 set domain protein, putative [Ricinus communis]|eukprot:XP_002528669.1 histone-lysine N-methyltransferase ASHH1 [Ricinus communis]
MDQWIDALALYEHIQQNDFSYRKHRKQKEEDIAICECRFDASDPESACGERCLNVLTSTECTPGYCRCGIFCKNQRFQKCEYFKTRLFKTEGRGWGLLADEDIKAGQFIIEYCGEVISWKEAKRRSQAYERQGLKDAFIISLNSSESIDATRKGSLARFINHSCQPNCETRKWNVLGEIRVGIFAKQDISIGTELAYDYNFEWYGGAKVRCLCGSASCSGFLGAKSRGFQEDTYLWEDDDDRYSVEKIPLYDSAEDEPSSKLLKTMNSNFEDEIGRSAEYPTMMNFSVGPEHHVECAALTIKPVDSIPIEGAAMNPVKTEASEEISLYSQDSEQNFVQKSTVISLIEGSSGCGNCHTGRGPVSKKLSKHSSNGKLKHLPQKQVDVKHFANLLAVKEAQDEVLTYEERKNEAASQLSSLYNQIRPAIEEHERDNQDSVATSVAEKWIEVCCLKLKAEFDLYSSIIKNVACTPRRAPELPQPPEIGENDNEVKYLGL